MQLLECVQRHEPCNLTYLDSSATAVCKERRVKCQLSKFECDSQLPLLTAEKYRTSSSLSSAIVTNCAFSTFDTRVRLRKKRVLVLYIKYPLQDEQQCTVPSNCFPYPNLIISLTTLDVANRTYNRGNVRGALGDCI